jgi:anti-sigma regulatory factor (Ser/Thr protein kinase)
MSARFSTADLPPKSEARGVGMRLHRKPVHGSVFLGLMPSQPQPSAAWVALFPVSQKSPARARADVELFLANCSGIPDDFDDMVKLLVSELVTNAYKAMSIEPTAGIECIELSLRLFDDHLLIEVIDSSPKAPAPKLAEDAEALSSRGLAVVDHMSDGNWGWFWRSGRKVVFCKLPFAVLGKEN